MNLQYQQQQKIYFVIFFHLVFQLALGLPNYLIENKPWFYYK